MTRATPEVDAWGTRLTDPQIGASMLRDVARHLYL